MSNLKDAMQTLQPMKKLEALQLREQYGYLKGRTCRDGDGQTGEIVAVAISPHDKINKWIFLHYYQESGDEQQALEFYTPPFFDVLVICRFPHRPRLQCMDLRSYLEKHAIVLEANG